ASSGTLCAACWPTAATGVGMSASLGAGAVASGLPELPQQLQPLGGSARLGGPVPRPECGVAPPAPHAAASLPPEVAVQRLLEAEQEEERGQGRERQGQQQQPQRGPDLPWRSHFVAVRPREAAPRPPRSPRHEVLLRPCPVGEPRLPPRWEEREASGGPTAAASAASRAEVAALAFLAAVERQVEIDGGGGGVPPATHAELGASEAAAAGDRLRQLELGLEPLGAGASWSGWEPAGAGLAGPQLGCEEVGRSTRHEAMRALQERLTEVQAQYEARRRQRRATPRATGSPEAAQAAGSCGPHPPAPPSCMAGGCSAPSTSLRLILSQMATPAHAATPPPTSRRSTGTGGPGVAGLLEGSELLQGEDEWAGAAEQGTAAALTSRASELSLRPTTPVHHAPSTDGDAAPSAAQPAGSSSCEPGAMRPPGRLASSKTGQAGAAGMTGAPAVATGRAEPCSQADMCRELPLCTAQAVPADQAVNTSCAMLINQGPSLRLMRSSLAAPSASSGPPAPLASVQPRPQVEPLPPAADLVPPQHPDSPIRHQTYTVSPNSKQQRERLSTPLLLPYTNPMASPSTSCSSSLVLAPSCSTALMRLHAAAPVAASSCGAAGGGIASNTTTTSSGLLLPGVLALPGASCPAEADEKLRALCEAARALPQLDAMQRLQLWARLEQLMAAQAAGVNAGGLVGAGAGIGAGQRCRSAGRERPGRYDSGGAADNLGGVTEQQLLLEAQEEQRQQGRRAMTSRGPYHRSYSAVRGYAAIWETKQRWGGSSASSVVSSRSGSTGRGARQRAG
ncbi:hypothetical protein Agub_g4761, partial [Astrephomene gubernaculifera]